MADYANFFDEVAAALLAEEPPLQIHAHGTVARGQSSNIAYRVAFESDGRVRRRIMVEATVPGPTSLVVGGLLRTDIAAHADGLTVAEASSGETRLLRWGPFQAVDLERRPGAAATWAASTIRLIVDILRNELATVEGPPPVERGARREPRPPRPAVQPRVVSDRTAPGSTQSLPPLLAAMIGRGDFRRPELSVRAVVSLPPVPAVREPMPDDVHPELPIALSRRGIKQLYRHQAEVWRAVRVGRDVVIVTPTASGKSLSFNLPILDRCLKAPDTRALYFYPTKALANDQLTALEELLSAVEKPPSVAVYHGDLSREEREAIRADPPNLLLATPDILHHQQLPKHGSWARWWEGLRFVVVDEAHAYRGVFGTHVAHLIRRIRRTARKYRADPIFIAASATIGNPKEHVENLIGRPPAVVEGDAASQAGRDVVIWDPLILDGRGDPVAFGSSESEAAKLLIASVRADLSTIVFARSRRSVERILRRCRRELERAGEPDRARAIEAYRSGYSRERRQEIEGALRAGELKGVVATNALELGVDIGSLDVAVLSTYPGSTMSFRQQAGRAGRRDRPALVVLISSQNPLDQFVASTPDSLVRAPAEQAVVDLANPKIAAAHFGCAAREHPLTPEDHELYGNVLRALTTTLVQGGVVLEAGAGLIPGPRAPRPRDVSLRSIDGRPYGLYFGAARIGEIDARSVAREAHQGAVYLHDGEAYRVESVDPFSRTIQLTEAPPGILTEPIAERYIDLLSMNGDRTVLAGRARLLLGQLKVSTRVVAYREVEEETGRPRGDVIAISPMRFDLTSVGVRLEPFAGIDPAGMHGVEHLMRALAPLTILCDQSDLDGHTEINGDGAAYVYDRHEGGVGLSERLFGDFDAVVAAMAERVDACGCDDGCPACVQSGSCLLDNDVLDKGATASLLGVAS